MIVDDEKFMNKILQCDFQFFCEKTLNDLYVGKQKLNFQQILKWNVQFLGVFTDIKKIHHSKVNNFHDILVRIAEDIENSNVLYESLKELIDCILVVSPKMRTEFVLHIIKYINSDTETDKVKGWQLMALVSNYIHLQESFFYYLLNFIFQQYSETQYYSCKKYSAFAFLNFVKNFNKGERTVQPLISQIQQILKLQKQQIRIYLTPFNYIETQIEFYETAEQTKEYIMDYLNIPKDQLTFFQFYEISRFPNYQDEVFIENFVRLSDVVASFCHSYNDNPQDFLTKDHEENKFIKSVGYNPKKAQIFFRQRYFLDKDQAGPLFIQFQNRFSIQSFFIDFINSNIPLKIDLQKKIFAIFTKMKFKNTGIKFHGQINDYMDFLIFQQIFYLNSNDKRARVQQQDVYETFMNYAKDEYDLLQKNLLSLVSRSPCFQAELYKVRITKKQSKALNLPESMNMLIGFRGISLVNQKGERLKNLPYNTVVRSLEGKGHIIFIIKPRILTEYDKMMQKNNYYPDIYNDGFIIMMFKTHMSKKIYKLFCDYVNIKINGFAEQTKLQQTKKYDDTFQFKLDIGLLRNYENPHKNNQEVKRFFKI